MRSSVGTNGTIDVEGLSEAQKRRELEQGVNLGIVIPFTRTQAGAGLFPDENRGVHTRIPVPTGVIDAFIKTTERWGLRSEDQIALLGYRTNPGEGARLLSGWVLPTSQDIPDRVGYVLGISLGLEALFDGGKDAEMAWLTHTRFELGGETPLRFVLKGSMANLIIVSALVQRDRAL